MSIPHAMPLTGEPRSLYDQLYALPETVTGEILDGELIVNPRPMPRHAVVLRNLLSALRPFFENGRMNGDADWIIWPEVELHLDPDVMVPDLSGWRRARMPFPDLDRQATLVPDWVCEILSPSTRQRDLGIKRRLYRSHGVAFYWLVDPMRRTLDGLVADGTEWRSVAALSESEGGRTPPFDRETLDLASLWGE